MVMKIGNRIKLFIKEILDPFYLSEAASRLYNYICFYLNLRLHYNNIIFKIKGAPDGLPLPPASLIFYVGGFDLEVHYYTGLEDATCIKNILRNNNLDIDKFSDILDFGCGLGRIIRHWAKLKGPRLYGTDYNARLIKWCQKTFNYALFHTNTLIPNLPYEYDKFDFIYAVSVFTHLNERLQYAWMDELARRLKPGGYLLITVHGTSFIHGLSTEQKEEFNKGNLVILHDKYSGANYCGAFHPERYVREKLCKNLKVIDFIPRGSKGTKQDVFLLQKPAKYQSITK
jgi:SAM-dependent methyltransferase